MVIASTLMSRTSDFGRDSSNAYLGRASFCFMDIININQETDLAAKRDYDEGKTLKPDHQESRVKTRRSKYGGIREDKRGFKWQ